MNCIAKALSALPAEITALLADNLPALEAAGDQAVTSAAQTDEGPEPRLALSIRAVIVPRGQRAVYKVTLSWSTREKRQVEGEVSATPELPGMEAK